MPHVGGSHRSDPGRLASRDRCGDGPLTGARLLGVLTSMSGRRAVCRPSPTLTVWEKFVIRLRSSLSESEIAVAEVATVPTPAFALFGIFPRIPPDRGSGMLPVGRSQDLRGRRERRRELTGAEFGALKVLGFAGRARSCRNARWTAECRVSHGGCGEVGTWRGSELRVRTHCGCRCARTRVTFQGLTLPLTAWEKVLRQRGVVVSWRRLKKRLRAGWTPEETLSTPAARRAA